MLITFDAINLDQIAYSGQCFRWRKEGDGGYAIPCFGEVLHIRQTAENIVEADCSEEDWHSRWAAYFDADCPDYAQALAAVPESDQYLMQAAQAGRGIRILRQPLWETMASFIISQNNNIPRITKTLERLCEVCGGAEAFPSPECVGQMTEEQLRQLGMGYRARYIQQAARRFTADRADLLLPSMDEAQAQAYLTSYLGVGMKVADCIRLFALGQHRTFPVDTWIKRILKEHYSQGLPEAYAPYGGIYQQYMFFYERQCAKQAIRKRA